MQVESASINKQKLAQTIQKYVELIKQNKVYQFTQKVQLLAHRKQQSKKYQQAQFLLFCGIEKLLVHTSEQVNQGYSLFDHLLKLYEHHKDIWNLEKGKRVFELLNIRKNQKRFQYYVRFLKTLKNAPFPKDLLLELVGYYVSKEQFTKAQSHILELDVPLIRNFFQKWSLKVSAQQATAIQCRLALLRGLFSNFEQCQQILQGVNTESPYYRFTKFLISTSKLKSRQAYDLIGSRYKSFLDSDEIYKKIYLGYGSYFFKINNSDKGGLMGIFA